MEKVKKRIKDLIIFILIISIGFTGVICFIMLPNDNLDAFEKTADGDKTLTYRWLSPVYEGNYKHYEYKELTLTISENEYKNSMCQHFRWSNVVNKSMGNLVNTEGRAFNELMDYLNSYTESYTDLQKAEVGLSFVNKCIKYQKDESFYGFDDYWTSPTETLYNKTGDCEDKSILLASIYKSFGLDVVLFDFTHHVSVGVKVEGASGYSYDGYYNCEAVCDTSSWVGYQFISTDEVVVREVCTTNYLSDIIVKYKLFIHNMIKGDLF